MKPVPEIDRSKPIYTDPPAPVTPGAAVADQRRWELLLPHIERLRRLVRSRLGSHADVDDCVQEALLRAASFARLDESRLGPFLTATALRLCVDRHRERGRQLRLQHRVAFPETVPTPEETVCEHQLGRWLLAQAQQLPDRERQVMLARASGMSTVEAAERYNMSVKAAESAFTRGRHRLRGLLETVHSGTQDGRHRGVVKPARGSAATPA